MKEAHTIRVQITHSATWYKSGQKYTVLKDIKYGYFIRYENSVDLKAMYVREDSLRIDINHAKQIPSK